LFKADMIASCKWQHGSDLTKTWSARRCAGFTDTYYNAVRKSGKGSYKGPANLNY
jgi:hypothetical protein